MVKKIVKKNKKKPIIDRHKRVLKSVGECRKLNVALKKEGYTESYIKSGRFKKTNSWKELMEKFLPDDLLAKKHKELLNKKEFLARFNKEGKIEVLKTGEIDAQAVKSGLDMAYKLKSKYGETTIRHKFGNLSDEELEEEIAGEISEGFGIDEGEEA